MTSSVGKKGRDLEEQSLATQLRAKRSQMMVEALEGVALRLFEQRGVRSCNG